MKLRKLATVAGLSAALVIGGAGTAFAAAPSPEYWFGTDVSGAAPAAGPVLPYVPGQAVSVTRPETFSDVAVYWVTADRFLNANEFTVTFGSTTVTLSDTFVRNNPGTQEFRVLFGNGGVWEYATTIRLAVPAAPAADGVRPQHPATGPAALVYGVGGLLLAGGGVSLVAAGKRRKAELV